MHELIGSFLSNESRFGRVMTRCAIIVAANLLFILFSFPVVTAGAALAALYHVMFKTLRGDGVINPFAQFWTGFRTNFRQATVVWLLALALAAFGYFDVQICRQAGGWIGGRIFEKVPVSWLKRIFALLILYGAWKALCS